MVGLRAYDYVRDGCVVRLSELSTSFQGDHVSHPPPDGSVEYARLMRLMNAGNEARRRGGGDVLAIAAATAIHAKRSIGAQGQRDPLHRHAHILRSLKHPAEVLTLRRIYGPGFFLIGVVTDPTDRRAFLETRKGCTSDEIDKLIRRDEHEGDIGQRTRDTFELSDVFLGRDPVRRDSRRGGA